MKSRLMGFLAVLCLCGVQVLSAQDENRGFPKTVEAGSAFSIHFAGSGPAKLYIVGLSQAIKRDIQLGAATEFAAGSLSNAGHYAFIVAGVSSSETGEFDVVPASKPAELSFIAKPSRLQVGVHNGITGAVYVFDGYGNLITAPTSIHFELSNPAGNTESRSLTTRNGAAWTEMDSSAQQGADKFVAQVNGISSVRVIRQVPGDPCSLKMNAKPAGQKVQLITDPVRDCNGNAVPDGTVVTFTEIYNGSQSTADVPLKRGIAEIEMPSHPGSTISVASGVVLGNQIRWEK
jgi:hypothetical protein